MGAMPTHRSRGAWGFVREGEPAAVETEIAEHMLRASAALTGAGRCHSSLLTQPGLGPGAQEDAEEMRVFRQASFLKF